MRVIGLLSPNTKLQGGVWQPDYTLKGAETEIRVDLESSPFAYTGRDLFTLVWRFNGKGLDWIDMWRETLPTKCTPSEYLSPRGIPAFAAVLTGVGVEPILLLFGFTLDAFALVQPEQILRTPQEVRAFYDSAWPEIRIVYSTEQEGYFAESTSRGEIYWEVTGGYLDRQRTFPGEIVKVIGAAKGCELRAGYKNYSNIARVLL